MSDCGAEILFLTKYGIRDSIFKSTMGLDTSTLSVLVLLFIVCTAIPIAAATSSVTDINITQGDKQLQERPTTSNETVAVVITLQNDTARQHVSFDSNVIVTGGRDVDFMPVLFARTTVATIPRIESKPNVTSVEVDRQVTGPEPLADTDTGTAGVSAAAAGQTVPWNIKSLGTQRISDRLRSKRTENVTVAVIDSGVDYTHPDLGDAVVWGVDFTGDETKYGREAATDNSGHGTAVAGIVAADDNERGVVGIAPGTQLYSIKVLDQANTGTVSSLIAGMDAALEGPDGTLGTDDDADVLQMSVGTTTPNGQLAAATAAASESAVVVNSAGNDGDNDPSTMEVTFPAAYEGTIAVAATETTGETTLYSAEGDAIDVAAPGNYIETLRPGGGTMTFVGTSAAAPHVSGLIALLLAADDDSPGENRTASDFRNLVSQTAADIEKPGTDRRSGTGLVQADDAVAKVLPTTVKRTSTASTVTGGETVNITRTAYATDPNLTAAESFTPSMATAKIRTVTVNGEEVRPADQSANTSSVVVLLRGLDIGDKVNVTYTVETPVSDTEAEAYRIESANPDGTTEETTLRVDTQVSEPANTSFYDRDGNQRISLAELAVAAKDYADGEISLAELSDVARTYSLDSRS